MTSYDDFSQVMLSTNVSQLHCLLKAEVKCNLFCIIFSLFPAQNLVDVFTVKLLCDFQLYAHMQTLQCLFRSRSTWNLCLRNSTESSADLDGTGVFVIFYISGFWLKQSDLKEKTPQLYSKSYFLKKYIFQSSLCKT